MIAKDFRHSAWDALRGHWGAALLTGLIASVLGGGVANFGGFNMRMDPCTGMLFCWLANIFCCGGRGLFCCI